MSVNAAAVTETGWVFWGLLSQGLIWIFVILIILGFLYWAKKNHLLKKHPYKAIILEQRGENPTVIGIDTLARITLDEGTPAMHLKKARKVIGNIKNSFITPTGWIYLYKIEDEYHPVKDKYTDEFLEFVPSVDATYKIVYSSQLRENAETFKKDDFMSKYAPFLGVAAMGMILVIMLYVTIEQFQPVIDSAVRMSSSNLQVSRALTNHTEVLKEIYNIEDDPILTPDAPPDAR